MLLSRLRLVPERVHFSERSILRRFSAGGERALDGGKAAFEFLVGLSQQRFRVGAQTARQIDRGKEKIADFGRRIRLIGVKRVLDLVGLFTDFTQHGARIVPIESDLARLGL